MIMALTINFITYQDFRFTFVFILFPQSYHDQGFFFDFGERAWPFSRGKKAREKSNLGEKHCTKNENLLSSKGHFPWPKLLKIVYKIIPVSIT